jgi:hydrogenase nickel incorporation protein HypA/HybF
MHELPVTQGILAVVLEVAQQTGAQRIMAIDLVIGEFSSIVDDCVQFYFDILSRETLAEGAILRFQREPAITTCSNCGQQTSAKGPLLPVCPACGSAHLRVTGGREFYIESMEVAYEDSGGERDPQCERSGGA